MIIIIIILILHKYVRGKDFTISRGNVSIKQMAVVVTHSFRSSKSKPAKLKQKSVQRRGRIRR